MGHDVTVMQVLAGENGRLCLQACEKLGIRSIHVWAQGETRQCLTLCDEKKGTVTEVIEPFAVDWSPHLSASLFRAIEGLESFNALVILGTLPAGCPGNFYHQVLQRVSAELRVLDALQGLSLDDLRLVHWLKVNRSEWDSYRLLQSDTIPVNLSVLISNGSKPAELIVKNSTQGWLRPSVLTNVQNPIGAGDTMTASLVDQILAGREAVVAAKMAMALAGASCLDKLPAHWNEKIAEEILTQIQFEPTSQLRGGA